MTKHLLKRMGLASCLALSISLLSAGAASAQTAIVYGQGNQLQSCYAAALIPSAVASSIRRCDAALANDMVPKKHKAHILVNRGILFQANGDYAKAYADYQRAIELDSDLPEAYANRGIIYNLMNRNDLALLDYDRALASGSAFESRVRLNRAMALMDSGRPAEAKAEYQLAQQASDDDKGHVQQKWAAYMAYRSGT